MALTVRRTAGDDPPITHSLIQRFWARIDVTEQCWIWIGGREHYGHGRITVGNLVWKAHRLSWTIHHGAIPRGLFVLHNCPGGDNPSCVRPDHLFLGSQPDNVADMLGKGRHVSPGMPGETNPQAKVSDEVVAAIRGRYAAGGTRQRDLAAEFGLSQTHVSRLIRGQRRQQHL